jgi:hypothetical protein
MRTASSLFPYGVPLNRRMTEWAWSSSSPDPRASMTAWRGRAFGAVESRLDGAITGPWIQALKFDGHIIRISIRRASADSESFGYRYHCEPIRREMLGNAALGRGELLRPLVDHAEANPVDRTLIERGPPFGPLNGRLRCCPRLLAAEFGAAGQQEIITVFLPGTRFRRTAGRQVVAAPPRAAMVRRFIRIFVIRIRATVRPVGSHAVSSCCSPGGDL